MEGVAFLIRTRQFRFPVGMNGTEDVIVDHNMVVTQVFHRLGKRLDHPVSPPSSICGYTAPAFIAHFLFHGVTSCAGSGPFASDPEAADRGCKPERPASPW